MELNHTCLELLKILYEQKDYINIGILADRIGKTERSVRYSLDRIDEFLIRKSFPFSLGNSAPVFILNGHRKRKPSWKIPGQFHALPI